MDDRLSLKHRLVFRFLNVYPPFVGAGIRVRAFVDDPYTIDSSLSLRFYNRNALGTHFGGSLYAMCDPFFVLIVLKHLGPRYVVWDKAATIEFKKPGRGTVRARFRVAEEEIARLRSEADAGSRVEPVYEARVLDEQDEVVAVVTKRLYVRKARPDPPEPS